MKFLIIACLLLLGGVSAEFMDYLDSEEYFEEMLNSLGIGLERPDFLAVGQENDSIRFSDEVLGFLDKLMPELCDIKPDNCSVSNTYYLDCNCVTRFATLDEGCSNLLCETARDIRRDAPRLLNILFTSTNMADIFKSIGETFDALFGGRFCTCGEGFFKAVLGCAKFYDANFIYDIPENTYPSTIPRVIRNLDLLSLNKFLAKITKYVCATSGEGKCYNSIFQSLEKAGGMVDQSFRRYDELEEASAKERKEMKNSCGLFYRVLDLNKSDGVLLEMDAIRPVENGAGGNIACKLYSDSPDNSPQFSVNGEWPTTKWTRTKWTFGFEAVFKFSSIENTWKLQKVSNYNEFVFDLRDIVLYNKLDKTLGRNYVSVVVWRKDFELSDNGTSMECLSRKYDLQNQHTLEVYQYDKVGPVEASSDCLTSFRVDYRGNISKTVSGRTCKRWDLNYTHSNIVETGAYPARIDDFGKHNHCRNFLQQEKYFWYKGGAWCFTTDPDKEWEYCDVPRCNYISLELLGDGSITLEEGFREDIPYIYNCALTADQEDETLDFKINGISIYDKEFDRFWNNTNQLKPGKSGSINRNSYTWGDQITTSIVFSKLLLLQDNGTTFRCISEKHRLLRERSITVYSSQPQTQTRPAYYTRVKVFDEIRNAVVAGEDGEVKARTLLTALSNLTNKVYCDKRCSSQIAEILYPCCYKDLVSDNRMFDYLEEFIVSVVEGVMIGSNYQYRYYAEDEPAYNGTNYTLPPDLREHFMKILHPAHYCRSWKKNNPKCAE